MLAQQVQQRRFDSGHHVNGGTQVKGLQAAAAGVTVGELVAHRAEHVFILAQRFAHHQRNGILQSLANFFAPRNFTDAVWPALSLIITILRVKYGAWAPLRFISILSWPATGITCMVVTTGVEEKVVIASSFCN